MSTNNELEKAKASYTKEYSNLILHAKNGEKIPKEIINNLKLAATKMKSHGYQTSGYNWTDPSQFEEWWNQRRLMMPADTHIQSPYEPFPSIRIESKNESCADEFTQNIVGENWAEEFLASTGIRYGFLKVNKGEEGCETRWPRRWKCDWLQSDTLDEWLVCDDSKLVVTSEKPRYTLTGNFKNRILMAPNAFDKSSPISYSAESICNHSIIPAYYWTSWKYKVSIRARHYLGVRYFVIIGDNLIPCPLIPGTYYHSKLGQTLTFWSNEDHFLELDSPMPNYGEGQEGDGEICQTKIKINGKWNWGLGALEFVTRIDYEIELHYGEWIPSYISGDIGLCWKISYQKPALGDILPIQTKEAKNK